MFKTDEEELNYLNSQTNTATITPSRLGVPLSGGIKTSPKPLLSDDEEIASLNGGIIPQGIATTEIPKAESIFKGIPVTPKTQRVQIPQATTQEQVINKEESWPKIIGKSIMGGLGQIGTGVMGAVKSGLDIAGIPVPEIGLLAKDVGEYWQPEVGDSTAKKYGAGIAQSMAGSLPLMLTGPAALPLFGVTSGGNKYLQMRDAGQDIKKSLAVAVPVGISEAVTELLPLRAIMKPGSSIIKRMLSSAALEVPGEEINTLVESVADKLTIKPNMTMHDYWSDFIDTAVITIGQSFLTAGLMHPVVKHEEKKQAERDAEETVPPPIEEPTITPPPETGGIELGQDVDEQVKKSINAVSSGIAIPETINAEEMQRMQAKRLVEGKWYPRTLEEGIPISTKATEGIAQGDKVNQEISDEMNKNKAGIETPQVAAPPAEMPETAPSGISPLTTQEPAGIPITNEIDQKAHEAQASPLNELPEPSKAQIDAGNLKLGHPEISGLKISIENPEGSIRRDKQNEPPQWESQVTNAHYGYIRETSEKGDGKLDVFVKPNTDKDYQGNVFVINQVDPKTGRFDELKTMLGYTSEEEAKQSYLANYEPGWKGLGSIVPMSMDQFKGWLDKGDTKKEVKPQEGIPLTKMSAKEAEAPQLRQPLPERPGIPTEEIQMQQPGAIEAIPPSTEVEVAKAIQGEAAITPNEAVNDITRSQMGDRIAKGEDVTEDIREGIRKHGLMAFQDALGKEESEHANRVSKGERPALAKKYKAVREQMKAIAGEITPKGEIKEAWETFTPNKQGYQSRELEGLNKDHFVAQQSPTEFYIINSEQGSTKAIVEQDNKGKWKFIPEAPVIGEDFQKFPKAIEKTYDTPQEAVLTFNEYKDMIDKPESVSLEKYKSFGNKESTHKSAVISAINRGEIPEGIKDYPELQGKTKEEGEVTETGKNVKEFKQGDHIEDIHTGAIYEVIGFEKDRAKLKVVSPRTKEGLSHVVGREVGKVEEINAYKNPHFVEAKKPEPIGKEEVTTDNRKTNREKMSPEDKLKQVQRHIEVVKAEEPKSRMEQVRKDNELDRLNEVAKAHKKEIAEKTKKGEEPSDKYTLSIERVEQPKFTVKKGDTVSVWFSKNKSQNMEIIGISKAKNEVKVKEKGAKGNGIWVEMARVYPVKEVTAEVKQPPVAEKATTEEVKEEETEEPEPPRTTAIGILSIGKVKKVEDSGYVFVKGDLEKGSDLFNELVGKVSIGYADRLVGRGITIEKKEEKTEKAKGIQFNEELRGSHHGQKDITLTLRDNGKYIGRIDYTDFDNVISVDFIEIEPEYRRKGYATKLLDELHRLYADRRKGGIKWSLTTEEGEALRKAYYKIQDGYNEEINTILKNLPPHSITKQTSGLYKDGYGVRITEGDHKGVVGFGNTKESALYEAARSIHSRIKLKQEQEIKAEKKETKKPPKEKLTSTDTALRRYWEMRKERIAESASKDADQQLESIQKETRRADLFDVPLGENATPGARRLIDAIRNNIIPFTEWAGRKAGGRKGRWSTKPHEALKLVIDGKSHITPEKLREWASIYIESLGSLRTELAGLTTVADISEKYTIWRLGEDYGKPVSRYSDRHGHMTGEIYFNELLRHNWGFTPDSYAVKDMIKDEKDATQKSKSAHDRPTHKLEDIHREGLPDYRDGRDVTGDDLKKTFGFTSVTYGHYTNQNVRQLHTNHAFDSFHDIAKKLGIKPEMISFNGKLHLAIGALGHGKASAHYSHNQPHPDGGTVRVINLTRDRGDGTVSHEWAHALDFYLQDGMTGKSLMKTIYNHLKNRFNPEYIEKRAKDFLVGGWHYTDIKNDKLAGAKRWLMNQRRKLDAADTTKFYRDASKMDAGKGEKGRYWSKPEEMFARAFEAAIYDTLEGSNPYLVNNFVSDGYAKAPEYKGTPYPGGDERSEINATIQEFLDNIEWTDAGVKVKDNATFTLDNSRAEYVKAIDKMERDIEDYYTYLKKEQIKAEEEAKKAKEPTKEEDLPITTTNLADGMSDDDITAMLDDVATEEFPETPKEIRDTIKEGIKEAKAKTEAKEKEGKEPIKDEKSLAELATDIKEAGLSMSKETMEGLYKLFGGGRIKMFPGLDESTYQEAKPHFINAYRDAIRAGDSIKEFARKIFHIWGEKVKPYLFRFITEVRDGKISIDKDAETATIKSEETKDEAVERKHKGRIGGRSEAGAAVDGQSEVADGVQAGVGVESLQGEQTGEVSGQEGGQPAGDRGRAESEGLTGRPGKGSGISDVLTIGHGATGGKSTGRTGAGNLPLVERGSLKPEERNNVITDSDVIVPETKTQRIKANIEAVKLVKQLITDDRNATVKEKKILQQFTGWGALSEDVFKNEFDNAASRNNGQPYSFWNDNEKAKFKKWAVNIGSELHPDLGGVMTKEEWRTAKDSTLNAHYTDRGVIKAMWQIAERLGIQGGRILEPAGGVGHFFGLMPQELADYSELHGVELDSITGNIFKALYPEAKVQVTGFQDAKGLKDNSFDLVISNFPFGDYQVHDPKHPEYSKWSIHNYFFARSLDAVKPGGIVLSVTSHFTMDALDTKTRAYLTEKADLIGAIRLPNTAFKKNAGTEVVTDIIILRKKSDISLQNGVNSFGFTYTKPAFISEQLENEVAGLEVRLKAVMDRKAVSNAQKKAKAEEVTQIKNDLKGKRAYINEYFSEYPNMVLGKNALSGSMYGGNEYTVEANTDVPIEDQLNKAIESLPKDLVDYDMTALEEEPVTIATGLKEGTLQISDNKVYLVEDGVLKTPEWSKIEGMTERVAKYLNIKQSVNSIASLEMDANATDAEIESARKILNKTYDDFRSKYGCINDNSNAGYLDNDVEFYGVAALEDAENKLTEVAIKSGPRKGQMRPVNITVFKKSAIFARRVNYPFVGPSTAENIEDAVNISLMYRNAVSDVFIGKLINEEPTKVREELLDRGLAFENPKTGRLESKDQYLSGAVKLKLDEAKRAVKDNPAYKKNVEELEKVQPAPLPIEKIDFRLGSEWMPPKYIEEFMQEKLGVNATVKLIKTAESSHWVIDIRSGERNSLNVDEWAVGSISGDKLIEDSLNLRHAIAMKVVDDKGNTAKDEIATIQAQEKQKQLQVAFRKYASVTHGFEIEKIYNELKNGNVRRQWEAPKLDYFPGASHEINLRENQKRVAYRAVQESTLVAHSVGTGKTFAFITAAMEMKRLKTSRKALIVVQASTLAHYRNSIKKLYPNAKALIPNDKQRSAENRQRIFGQMRTGDHDIIVIPHSFFEMIPINPITESAYIHSQLAELEAHLTMAIESEGQRGPTVKQLRKILQRKEVQLLELANLRQDNSIYFEDLGLDALMVDECFSYETLIETDQGMMPIGEIVENRIKVSVKSCNVHNNVVEWKPIVTWFKNPLKGCLIEVIHETGSFICTPSHNVWTKNGYVQAGSLCIGEELFTVQEGIYSEVHWAEREENKVLQPKMRGSMAHPHESLCGMREGIQVQDQGVQGKHGEKVLQSSLPEQASSKRFKCNQSMESEDASDMGCVNRKTMLSSGSKENAGEQSDVRSKDKSENDSKPEGTHFSFQGGESHNHEASTASCGKIGTQDGVCNINEISQATTVRLSATLLQGGLGRPYSQIGNRSRRQNTSNEKMEISGCQENSNLKCYRVVGIKILESGSDGQYRFCGRTHQYVYNIEVADNHNYFANGVLVSNCHYYKRGDFFTKMGNIKGLDQNSSKRSFKLNMKAQHILEKTGGKNVIMATGTPISNTLAEIWTMVKYFRPDLLKHYGIEQFDGFASTFTESKSDMEQTLTGEFKFIERLNKYVNGSELLTMWQTAADIALAEDMDIPGRPKIKGGGPQEIIIERPQQVSDAIKGIKTAYTEWQNLPGNDKRELSWVPIVLYGRAKQIAVDVRLVDSNARDIPGSKTNRVAEEVFKRYEDSHDIKGTQVIFSDIIQSSDGKFNIYREIKNKLVKKGIPENQIAIITDHDTDLKRELLWDAVNSGSVRVVMGSTGKLGTGTEIQQRLIAAHHMDVPYRPMDFEQRNGRIVRPGNMNAEVEILVYGMKNTMDSSTFQLLLMKQKFINQLLRGDIKDRSFEDPTDEIQYSFEELMAAFSGNPLLKQRFGLENEVRTLEALRSSFYDELGQNRSKMKGLKDYIPEKKKGIETAEKESQRIKEMFPTGKVTSVVIDGKEHTEKLTEILDAKFAEMAKVAEEQFKKEPGWKVIGDAIKVKVNGVDVSIVPSAYAFANVTREEAVQITKDKAYKFEQVRYAYSSKDLTAGHSYEISSSQGLLQSIAYKIKDIHAVPEQRQQYLARDEKDIENLSKSVEKTFTQGSRLEEAKDELKVIIEKLAKESDADIGSMEISGRSVLDTVLATTFAKRVAKEARQEEIKSKKDLTKNGMPIDQWNPKPLDRKIIETWGINIGTAEAPKYAWIRGKVEDVSLWANKHFMLPGAPPSARKYDTKVDLGNAVPKGPEIPISPVLYVKPDKDSQYVFLSNSVAINAQYYQMIKQRHPKVEFKAVAGSDTIKLTEKDKFIGVVIPSRAPVTQYIQKMIDDYNRGDVQDVGEVKFYKGGASEKGEGLRGVDVRALEEKDTERIRNLEKATPKTKRYLGSEGKRGEGIKGIALQKLDTRDEEKIRSLEKTATDRWGKRLPEGSIVGVAKVDPETEIAKVAKVFGKDVIIVNITRPDLIYFEGITNTKDTSAIFISDRADSPMLSLIGHEMFHAMAAEQPKLAEDFAKKVGEEVIDFDVYAKNYRLDSPLATTELIAEEFSAEILGTQLSKESFWKQLSVKEPSLFKRLADFVVRFIGNLRDRYVAMHVTESLHIKDIDKIIDAASTVMAEYAKKQKEVQPFKTIGGEYEQEGARKPWLDGETVTDLGNDTESIGRLREKLSAFERKRFNVDSISEVSVQGANSEIINEIAQRFGKEVRFFRTSEEVLLSGYNGLSLPSEPNLIWLNVDSRYPHLQVLGHELMHTLQIDDPGLWNAFYRVLRPEIKNYIKFKEIYQKAGAYKDEEQLIREFTAEFLGQKFMDEKFWQGMSEKHPTMFQRVITYVKNLLDNLAGKTFDRDIDNYFLKDIEKARQAAINTMATYAKRKSTKGETQFSIVEPAQPLFQVGKEESPKLKLTQDQISGIVKEIQRIAGKSIKIDLKQTIEPGEEAFVALSKWGKGKLTSTIRIKGTASITTDVSGEHFIGMIELALNNMTMDTPYHEAFHIVQQLMLKPEERDFLAESFPDKNGVKTTELQANAFADYAFNNRQGMNSKMRMIFARVKNFFVKLKNYLNNKGFLSVEDIFEKAYTGKYAKERAREISGKEKIPSYSILSQKQTDTPEFKRWFGNSIVTENGKVGGKPMVVFHGTRGKFTEFDDSTGLIFFTDDKRAASLYAKYAFGESGKTIMPVYLQMNNPKIIDYKEEQDNSIHMDAEEAQAEGYDGLIAKNIDDGRRIINQYVVFKPTQVKSAISNQGTFDPNNPDISFSIDGETITPEDAMKSDKSGTSQFLNDIMQKAGKKLDPRVTNYMKKDLSWINKILNTPKYIGYKFREFLPVFKGAQAIYQYRDDNIADLMVKIEDYMELDKASRDKVDLIAEHYTLKNEIPKNDDLKAGSDSLPALTDKEIRALWSLKDTYNSAFNKIIETYVEMGGDKADISKELGRIKFYVPLSRFGEWAVTWRDPKESPLNNYLGKPWFNTLRDAYTNRTSLSKALESIPKEQQKEFKEAFKAVHQDKAGLQFETFESEFKAKAYANQKAKEGMTVSFDKMVNIARGTSLEGLDMYTLSALARFAEINPDIADPFLMEAKEFLKTRGFKKHFIERKETPGYSRDWVRVHADYIVGVSNYLARVKGIKSMKEGMDGINPKKTPDLYKYAQNYINYIENPREEAAGLRGALFLYYLGGNVKSAVLNLTQTITTAWPWLSQYSKLSSMHLSRAGKDVLKGIKFKNGMPYFDSAHLGPELSNALESAVETTNEQMVYEFLATSRGAFLTKQKSGQFGDAMSKSIRALSYMFGTAETWNRRVTFIAAFRIGKELETKGKLPKEFESVHEFARQAVENSQFVYGRYQRATIARGPILATFFTFKSFTLQYIEMLSRLAKQDKKSFFKALSIMLVLAGAAGLPFMDDLKKLFEKMTGTNLDAKARDLSNELLGDPRYAEVMLRGITRLGPVDMSGAIGLGDIVPEIDTISILGPAGGILQRFAKAMPYTARHEYLRALETISPEAIRNPLTAYRIAKEGHRDIRGQLIFSGEGRYGRELNVAAKALGFYPADLARAQERERAQAMIGGRRGEKKKAFVDRMARAIVDKDINEIKTLRQEIKDYNADEPKERRIIISPIAVRDAVRRLRLPEDISGMRYKSKRERPEYQRMRELFK